MMVAFDVEVFTTPDRGTFSGVIAVLGLFGPSSATFSYCASFLFTSGTVCNLCLIIIGLVGGLACPVATYALRLIGSDPSRPWEKLLSWAYLLEWLFRLLPSFNFGKALFYTINISTFDFYAGRKLSVWEKDILLFEVIAMVIQSVVYFAGAILLDKFSNSPDARLFWERFTPRFAQSWRRKYQKICATDIANSSEDIDVQSEEERVLSEGTRDDAVVLHQLRKEFRDGKVAVNNISLGIPHGECFGLLGINVSIAFVDQDENYG